MRKYPICLLKNENMKSKIFYKSLMLVLGLIMYGCNNEYDYVDVRLEADRTEFKHEVLTLANEYGVEVEFLNTYSDPSESDFKSIEEIERIFIQLKEGVGKKRSFPLYRNRKADGRSWYETRNIMSPPNVKTRSEIYSFSEWAFNLSWFSVSIVEDEGIYTVYTDFTGLSVYSYIQKYASGSCDGDVVTFNALGTLNASITSVVGFKLSYTVTANGSYNKIDDNGSVSLSYS